jgi:hypothetical protein
MNVQPRVAHRLIPNALLLYPNRRRKRAGCHARTNSALSLRPCEAVESLAAVVFSLNVATERFKASAAGVFVVRRGCQVIGGCADWDPGAATVDGREK